VFGNDPPAKIVDVVKNRETYLSRDDWKGTNREIAERFINAFDKKNGPIDSSVFESVRVPTEGQSALRALLDPGGSVKLETLMQRMDIHTAEKLLKSISDHRLSTDMAKTLGELVHPSASKPEGRAARLRQIDESTLDKLAELVAKQVVTGENVGSFHQLVGKGGADFDHVIGKLSTRALENLADIARETINRTRDINSNATIDAAAGFRGEQNMFRGLTRVMQSEPVAGGKTLAELGWRIKPAGNISASDKGGMDFILINVNDGTWLPLDISQRQKDKHFFQRYNPSEFFITHNSGVLADGNKGALANWLHNYISKHQEEAMDLSRLRPPCLEDVLNPHDRLRHLEQFQENLRLERARLSAERARLVDESKPVTGIDKAIEGLKKIEAEHLSGSKNHARLEIDLRERVCKALREHIIKNKDQFKDAASLAKGTLEVRAEPEARNMINLFDQDRKLRAEYTEGGKSKNLDLGTVGEIIQQVLRDLPPEIRAEVNAALNLSIGR
ncbi:MAG: hypothetical protein K2Z81_00505, partial [Cyanobacteria bacterium]|nr:hypothetical protein [Cyanobacteriota bacterium]